MVFYHFIHLSFCSSQCKTILKLLKHLHYRKSTEKCTLSWSPYLVIGPVPYTVFVHGKKSPFLGLWKKWYFLGLQRWKTMSNPWSLALKKMVIPWSLVLKKIYYARHDTILVKEFRTWNYLEGDGWSTSYQSNYALKFWIWWFWPQTMIICMLSRNPKNLD